MEGAKHRTFFLYVTLLLGLLLPGFAFSETLKKDHKNTESGPIVIESMTVEMNNELKKVTFSGDVNARRNDFIIDCDQMLVYYESMPDQQEKKEAETKINKIVAFGNVIINRAKGEQATAEKATYYQEDEKMVLTGNPTVTRGDDLVKGDRITIFLKEDRSVVEGSEKQKVSVTISPRREKR